MFEITFVDPEYDEYPAAQATASTIDIAMSNALDQMQNGSGHYEYEKMLQSHKETGIFAMAEKAATTLSTEPVVIELLAIDPAQRGAGLNLIVEKVAPVRTTPWPARCDELPDHEDMVEPFAAAIRSIYSLERHEGAQIAYKGLQGFGTQSMRAGMNPDLEQQLSARSIDYNDEDQGRDPLNSILSCVVRQGIGAGVGISMKGLADILILLLPYLADKAGVDEEAVDSLRHVMADHLREHGYEMTDEIRAFSDAQRVKHKKERAEREAAMSPEDLQRSRRQMSIMLQGILDGKEPEDLINEAFPDRPAVEASDE